MIRLIIFSVFYFLYALQISAQDESNNSMQYSYNEIMKKEKEINEEHLNLISGEYSFSSFYKEIIYPLNHNEKLNEHYLAEWIKVNEAFHQQRFDLIEKKQHFFMLLSQLSLHNLMDSFLSDESHLSFKGKTRINEEFEKIMSHFIKWSEQSDTVGQNAHPKHQRQRMYSFRSYFQALREFMTYLEKQGLHEIPTVKKERVSTGKIAWGVTKLGLCAPPLLFRILFRSGLYVANYANPLHYFLPKTTRNQFMKKIVGNSTPLTTKGGVTTICRGLAEILGYTILVTGKDNLKEIPLNGINNKKIVNLFLPSHRDGPVDAMVMSHLGLPHFLIFANPTAFAGLKVLANILAIQPEFISVGECRGFPPLKPYEKMLQALEEGRSPNIINYPQGFVSNAGEILPINRNFVELLLDPLIEEGYEINIIPISYEVDSSLLSLSGSVDEKNVTAKILPPLLGPAVRYLVKAQMKSGVRYFDNFLSTLWYSSIIEHNELSVNQFMDRMGKHLNLKFDPQWMISQKDKMDF